MKSFLSILQLKIVGGYILLLALLCTVAFLVRLEHGKMEELDSREHSANMRRKAVSRTFEKLLEFSLHDHFLLMPDSADIHECRNSCAVALDALNGLKPYYAAELHFAMDTISMLLLEKERLLHEVTNTLSGFPRADSLLLRKAPRIERQVRDAGQPDIPPAKKGQGLLNIFSRSKNKKSAYASMKEKEMRSLKRQSSVNGQFVRLQKDMYNQYADYRKRLDACSDSLRCRNRELNARISGLIHDFERATDTQYTADMEETAALRRQSFRIILSIAVTAVLLIVALYLFIHTDIRKRQKYRVALETACSRNEELLAVRRNLILTVSHDLRAPLGTISEYAELLQGERNGERSKGYAVNILRASRHVIGLANNLLYYYRLEAEKEQPEREIFHPGRTVEETTHSFRPIAARKGLGLTTEVTDSDVLVEGDSGRLVQILNNLLSNAVKFTRAGYIHVGARYRNGILCFFVRDTGTGIDKERQERLFTAFERGETQGTEQGFGLGLAITYKLVTLLDGTIRVQSDPGSGSTFEVCLPMREADGNPVNVSVFPEHDSLSGMRVLAIDDDRMQLDVTKKIYARNGVVCDCCLNIGELVSALRRNRYDLVLTDMRMPEMDGHGVLSLVRGSNLGQIKTLPVLAVTAQADEKPERFRNAGFAGCLYKPFSPEELLAETSRIDRPDFAAVMEGEENTEEMLDIFIEDTTEELSGMRDALSSGNYERLGHIIHKAAPLWGMIRINIPLGELEKMASMPPEKWNRTLDRRIEKLFEAVEQAVEKAKRLKEKTDGNHIDSRG